MRKLSILLILIIFHMNATDIEELFNGNKRFSKNLILQKLRKQNIEGQNPIAIVLTCSDSRVSPEIIFDKSIGEIFVVRNAGNVIDEVAIASIEFAIEFLKVPLVIVMGHQNCAAVQGALNITFEGLKANPESLDVIYEKIQPSLGKINSDNELSKAIIDNAIYQKNQLISRSVIIQNQLRKNKIKCLASYYNMDTGEVKMLE